MFFFARAWVDSSPFEFSRAPVSLGLFAGHPADNCTSQGDLFADLPAPRARPRRGWKVARAPGGSAVLLSGWIDNLAELASQLGIDTDAPEVAYGAAVERWGDRADAKIVGDYAALVRLPDGAIRLSRSPWCSKSIFWHGDRDALLISSIPRPLFAAGVPKRLRPDAIGALLRLDLPDPHHSAFEGIRTVPVGTVAHLTRDGVRQTSWYDPVAIRPVRFTRDQDYVDAARELLHEAVGKALAPARKPAMMLSGGLDSSLVCSEALGQLGPGERLTSFTFHPIDEWDGAVASHKFGNDRPYVERFAAMHPQLDPVFVDNRGIAFDDRAEQMYLACDAGYPGRVSASVYHGIYDAARDRGCDWVLGAGLGNATYSSAAPWAYAEFLKAGKWRQLWRMAAARLNDPRPVWRRVAAHAVVPVLPDGVQRAVRALIHPGRRIGQFANPFLNPNSGLTAAAGKQPVDTNIMTVLDANSHADYIRRVYYTVGLGAETVDGYEQVFGIQMRDVAAYRPLIEFCFGLPTEQFVADGESRRLARRMALGRMPEDQRTNRLYGDHNVDWHARLTPRVDELRERVRAIASHPELGPLIDTERALAALDNWPERTPDDPAAQDRYQFHLPAITYVARFVDFASGRNFS